MLSPFPTSSVSDRTYLKDPESSELGRKIIAESITLIDSLGFEQFTFRKLSDQIGSTEASIYRYFENKHRLLLYLISWYWNWMVNRLLYLTANITDPEVKLRKAINLITGAAETDPAFVHVDEEKLYRIVISESAKTYLTREVDAENQQGCFTPYHDMVKRVADLLLAVNPGYRFPHMLVSTVIEGAHHQRFFARHLPLLTDEITGQDSVSLFYEELIFRTIKPTVQ